MWATAATTTPHCNAGMPPERAVETRRHVNRGLGKTAATHQNGWTRSRPVPTSSRLRVGTRNKDNLFLFAVGLISKTQFLMSLSKRGLRSQVNALSPPFFAVAVLETQTAFPSGGHSGSNGAASTVGMGSTCRGSRGCHGDLKSSARVPGHRGHAICAMAPTASSREPRQHLCCRESHIIIPTQPN